MPPCPTLLFSCLVSISPPDSPSADFNKADDTGWSEEGACSSEHDALDEDCDSGELCTPDTLPHLVFDRPRNDPHGYDRLRTTHDVVARHLDTSGLESLNASGSSQFTRRGLEGIVQSMRSRRLIDDAAQFTIFDLRYEPHGEAEEAAVSWHVWNNWLNRDTPTPWAEADELARLAALARINGETTAYRICKQSTDAVKQVYYHPESLFVHTTLTEQQTAAHQGLHYVRLPMADHTGAPTDAAVEGFIQHVRTRSANSWWHFHCRKGVGRTTLFMAMLDMVHNAPRVSLESIAKRHVALSDVDILGTNVHEPHKSEARRRFARAFHAFCAAGMPGRWRDWPRES